jgi:hypothetical protein
MVEARRPRGLRGFARVNLVLAWLVFWLNTALFPCCEVVAAVFDGHAGRESQASSAVPTLHLSGATHSEPADHSPASACGDTLIPGSPLVGAYEALTPDRSPLEWYAVDAAVATSRIVSHSTDFALARATLLPSLRLCQRTQRLLI